MDMAEGISQLLLSLGKKKKNYLHTYTIAVKSYASCHKQLLLLQKLNR